MNYFFWGTIILFIATVIYYLIFFGFVYYWHQRKETFIVVPLMYTAQFFITGFAIVALGSLALSYGPEIIKAIIAELAA